MRRLEEHPLYSFLDPAGEKGVARLNITGMEQRELALGGIYDGEYRAFVVASGVAGGAGYRFGHDADVLWVVGSLTYNWFMWNGVPVDAAHMTRAFVEVHDVDTDEPLRTWFRVGYGEGRVEAKPVTNYTAPDLVPVLRHYLQPGEGETVRPDEGEDAASSLRIAAIFIPENRCPAPA
ncbi:MAG: hypothetical protein ACYTGX_15200 [Planctomycetota bacterium]|jgi:hypothetical protein